MSEMHWKEWIKNKCPQEKNWMEFNDCLKENTLDFQDLVLNQSHPADHHIQIQMFHGVQHILSLYNDSIFAEGKKEAEGRLYEIVLNKTIKYTLELKDPTFLYYSPNPLAFPTTRIYLSKNSSHQMLYLQVLKKLERRHRNHYVFFLC